MIVIDLSCAFNSGLEEEIFIELTKIKGIIDVDYIGSNGGFKNALGKMETYEITCFIQSADLSKVALGDTVTVRGKEYKIKEIINEQTDIVVLRFGQKT
ncbi:MAG: hypothetical protein LCH52_05450 [Bacteroidetes bacterium]|nr:hypothetical protein [Bacteroidota bacterium]